MLGQGTFGQVPKCFCEETGESVAVKVIKNQDAFFQQVRPLGPALCSLYLLTSLNATGDFKKQFCTALMEGTIILLRNSLGRRIRRGVLCIISIESFPRLC